MYNNATSGNAHLKAATEEEALDQVKEFVRYLPQNNNEKPPEVEVEEVDVTVQI